jgi:molecular chaperone GrpE
MVKKVKKDTKKVKKTATSSLKIKKLNTKIGELKDSLSTSDEKYLRLMAEFENFKRRNNRILSESYQKSIEKTITSFLPIIDDIHRVLNDNNNDSQIIIDGISMVQTKMNKILSSYDVEAFESKGDIFDPEIHEAIMSQNSDKKENVIIEEFEKGYKIDDKIIRHSKVIVSKGKK